MVQSNGAELPLYNFKSQMTEELEKWICLTFYRTNPFQFPFQYDGHLICELEKCSFVPRFTTQTRSSSRSSELENWIRPTFYSTGELEKCFRPMFYNTNSFQFTFQYDGNPIRELEKCAFVPRFTARTRYSSRFSELGKLICPTVYSTNPFQFPFQ